MSLKHSGYPMVPFSLLLRVAVPRAAAAKLSPKTKSARLSPTVTTLAGGGLL